jgi:hypothetical protein
MTYHHNHCSECNWRGNTETHSQYTVAHRATIHILETSHSIDSDPIPNIAKTILRI